MGEHTPTPWHFDHLGIFAADGVLARIPNHPDNGINWDADAAFIVKAVNSHDALVKALEKIIEMNRQHAKDQYGDADKAESWACITVARKALASIKERA